jgi:hypothetical protein
MSAPPAPPPPANGNGLRHIEAATRRAERARARFDEELDGLIDDLREAREVLRAEAEAREGDGDEHERGAW